MLSHLVYLELPFSNNSDFVTKKKLLPKQGVHIPIIGLGAVYIFYKKGQFIFKKKITRHFESDDKIPFLF